MTKSVPKGYLSIREALNRLGRELFPAEWTGEEYKARGDLITRQNTWPANATGIHEVASAFCLKLEISKQLFWIFYRHIDRTDHWA